MKTCKEKALEWNVSPRSVNDMCKKGRIQGAIKEKGSWLIPDDSPKPMDRRVSNGKYIKKNMVAKAEVKSLPIGISDYVRAQEEYYYVDKTLLIKEFLDQKPLVSLFTRPRRFGKTLNMDMLRVFFEISDKNTSKYFADKNIWQCGEEYRSHQGKYPVIFLTFKDVKFDTWDATIDKIRGLLQEEYGRHQELLNSDKLSQYEKEYFTKIISATANEVELTSSLERLSKMLWRKLQREKLVKHSIEEIENSDLFKYSPYKELNDSQRQAVEDIVQKLKEGTVDKVVVNGMPGSGKTIVAVYLMKYLADSEEYAGKQIGFVVPQTSLRKTMKIIFRSIYGLSPSQVLSPSDVTKKKYDILLVDEAHRLHQYKNISYMGIFKANCEKLGLTTEADELDWILMQSKQAVLFYDSMQVVGPSGIDFERFDKKMEDSFNRRMIAYFTLITQMRVQGGNAYIDQVKDMLAGSCSSKYVSEKYDFKLYSDFSKFEKDMYAKENEVGLSRMLAGYAWPWISKNDQALKDIEIQDVKRMWNHCTEGWVHTAEAIDEVGCIHSIQGYDLNYAFVILGKDIGYDKAAGKIIVRPECYFDKNGKRTANYEELLEYITNVYYVLMTRGIKGTYLYVCDDELREYLSQYMEVEK